MDEHISEKRLVAKINWHLLPIIALSYLIAYMDRNNLSYASVSMNADLGFSQTVYGLGASAFFLSYSLFEVPSNLLLQRFGARRWIARIMFTWGIIAMLMVFVTNAWSFYLLRFLLGMAEAGFYPGVVHYLSDWLPANQRARAISRFYIAVPVGTILMGAVAAPLLALDGTLGIAGWQWLFIIEALPALVMAVVILTKLPDAPSNVNWLDAQEKSWLIDRLAKDAVAGGGEHHGLWRALAQPVVLTLGVALALCFATSSAIAYSTPKLLMTSQHWSMAAAGSAAALTGLGTIPFMLATGAFADRLRRPFRLMAMLLVLAAVGALAMAMDPGTLATPAGLILFVAAVQSAGMMVSILISRYTHPATRAPSLAMANTMGQAGAFSGPLLWGIAADQTGSFAFGLAMVVPVLLASALGTMIAEQTIAGRKRHSAVATA